MPGEGPRRWRSHFEGVAARRQLRPRSPPVRPGSQLPLSGSWGSASWHRCPRPLRSGGARGGRRCWACGPEGRLRGAEGGRLAEGRFDLRAARRFPGLCGRELGCSVEAGARPVLFLGPGSGHVCVPAGSFRRNPAVFPRCAVRTRSACTAAARGSAVALGALLFLGNPCGDRLQLAGSVAQLIMWPCVSVRVCCGSSPGCLCSASCLSRRLQHRKSRRSSEAAHRELEMFTIIRDATPF